jgi:hypothetical protein
VTATAAWPFGTDADRDDPLTLLRVPTVWTFNPMWRYVAAYIKPHTENPYHWGSTERPTDAEAAMLASFIQEYLQHWFRDSYIRKLAERPLDVDSGCNTTLFVKYGPDDWGYRLASWDRGPLFVPQAPQVKDRGEPMSLERVMDRRHTIADDKPMQHWLDWKAQHPEVFA